MSKNALPIRSSIALRFQTHHMRIVSESKHLPRPRDPNQLAKLMIDIAAGEHDNKPLTEDGRDLAAVLLGRRGGLKGGPARAASMSSERRSEIARMAAASRWKKDK